MQELAEHPSEQFKYLKKLVLQNEGKIQRAIEESLYDESKRIHAERYIQYLTTLTDLMCQFEKDQVQLFVRNDFYPIKACLDICQKHKAKLACAVLHKRNGDYIPSLMLYFELINEECDPKSMLQEMNYIYVDFDKHLLRTELDKKLSYFEFPLSDDYQHMHHFDCLLDEALTIALKNSELLGEEPWILILEFLQDYSLKIIERLMETYKRKVVSS
jgi:hypothetical protein